MPSERQSPISKPPAAFISYSRDSAITAQWVAKFAATLRKDGIDAILDQYVVSPAEGWPRWAQNAIYDSDFVIFVCTETYRSCFEGRVTDGTGRGVTWEGLIANQILYDSYCRNKGFIAITLDTNDENLIPVKGRGSRGNSGPTYASSPTERPGKKPPAPSVKVRMGYD